MVDYNRYNFLKVEKQDKVAVVTMNQPEALNSITKPAHAEVTEIFLDLNRDEEVFVVILTGAGRAFSAGGSFQLMKQMIDDHSTRIPMDECKELIQNLLSLRKPIIAAVNGDCIGLGASIALTCDIIIAAEGARFADPHVGVGMVAGDGGCVIWPLQTSLCKAKQYLMTGALVKAAEAERLGLINTVVPTAEDVMAEAQKMARKFADGPIQAISWTKIVLNKIAMERWNLLFDAAIAYEYHSMDTPDHIEAVHAFLEKRPPNFKGGRI